MEAVGPGPLKSRLVLPLSLVLGVVLVGTLGYRWLWRESGGTWLDALFMTFTTITTIGYGEVKPLDGLGRIFTMGIATAGIGAFFSARGRGAGSTTREGRMEYRLLGRTGLRVSVLGFGCGNVGGLMVRGTPAERERAVARAVELGVNFFDTAPSYGDGLSEEHLGQALQALRPACLVATKVRLGPDGLADPARAVTQSLETSLRRLRRERVDLLQLHDPIRVTRAGGEPGAAEVLERILPAFEALRRAGRVGFVGLTALGDTPALHRVVAAGGLDSAQVCFNLLNPTAGFAVPRGFPAQDFDRLLQRTRAHGVGVVVIRVLAAGALSGQLARHPVAVPAVDPIATGPDYATDVARARALQVLVEEGHASSLVEAALRFPLGSEAVSTVLLGCSGQEHLEAAAAAVAKGPLSATALDRLAASWREMAPGA
jgi:L-galactose dehydrogenase/L-glyceraldehyde 3-phosphate reductase